MESNFYKNLSQYDLYEENLIQQNIYCAATKLQALTRYRDGYKLTIYNF